MRPLKAMRASTRAARAASAASMIRRRSHRSTRTPANVPTATVGTAAARSRPLTAAGAHGCPRATDAAIQMVSVVSKKKSPRIDTVSPVRRNVYDRLMIQGKERADAPDDVLASIETSVLAGTGGLRRVELDLPRVIFVSPCPPSERDRRS